METIDLYINQIIESVKVLKKLDPKDKRAADVRQGLRRHIQYYTNHTPWIYSVKAKQHCESLGVDIDKLPKDKVGRIVGGTKSKPALLGEHTTPIIEFISLLISSPIGDIRSLLENYSPVCWVTREEDNVLNKNGFSRKRPNGWKECYESCGIKPILK
jgi:hypothetical protein